MTARSVAAVTVLALFTCAAPEPEFGSIARYAPPEAGLPSPLEVPWPHDVYRSDADGTLADGVVRWPSAVVGGTARAWEAYGALDGFGLNAGVFFRLEGELEVDPASLPSQGAACLDEASAVALVNLETGERLPCTAGFSSSTRVLVVVPERPLAQGVAYAAGLTWGVRLADGRALGPAEAFRTLRDRAAGARGAPVDEVTGRAVDGLVRAGVEKRRLVAATAFTTTTAPRRLKATRDALVAGGYGAAPTLLVSGLAAPLGVYRFGADAHAGWTGTLDAWLGPSAKSAGGDDMPGLPGESEGSTVGIAHDALGAVLTAAFAAPEFRRPFAGTVGRDDGTIDFGADGRAKVQRQAVLPVSFFLPRAAPPASGWPVVIFQHGGMGSRANAGLVANELARRGIATVAVDAPFHGLRAEGAVDLASLGRGSYVGPDGFPDAFGPASAAALMGNYANWAAARDNYSQGLLDLAQLRRLLPAADLALVADQYGVAPKLDDTRVGYGGMSMGAVFGAVLAGLEPGTSVGPFFLDVGGGRVAALAFAEAPDFSLQLPLVAAAANPPEGFTADPFHPWLHLVQGLVDGADPSAFAGEAGSDAQGHDLYVMAAAHDTASPASASDLLARELGLSQVTPALRSVAGLEQVPSPFRATPGGRLRGYFEVSPAGHGHLLYREEPLPFRPPWPVPGATGPARFVRLASPVRLREAVLAAQRSMAHFFATSFSGTAEISVTGSSYPGLTPVADFDGDGFCDGDEESAGADPCDALSVPTGRAQACLRELGW